MKAVELRSHGVAEAPAIVPQHVEVILTVAGNKDGPVRRTGPGFRQEAVPKTGAIWLSPAGVGKEIVITAPIPQPPPVGPWNGANVLSWRAVLSPVAAGNTVVVKPSELAPISAGLILAQIAEEAGFPAGVINVVTHAPGAAPDIANVFFESQDVRVINLIGGVKTAKMLAKRAGETLKRTTMELGGYNPMIILDDVDVDYAVRTATFGSFFHRGQIGLNTRRIIVQRKIADEFLKKFAARPKTLKSGDPQDHTTVIGPLITPAAVKLAVQAPVRRVGTARGCRLRASNRVSGLRRPQPGAAGYVRWRHDSLSGDAFLDRR